MFYLNYVLILYITLIWFWGNILLSEQKYLFNTINLQKLYDPWSAELWFLKLILKSREGSTGTYWTSGVPYLLN